MAVNLTKKDWVSQVKLAATSTYLNIQAERRQRKVGKSTMDVDDIVENAVVAINGAANKIPRKWGNIQSIYIKTTDSVALPVYTAQS